MNATEIHRQVLLGSHEQVKAFLAPTIAQIQTVITKAESKATVDYDGCGGVRVMLEADDCASNSDCWKRIWAAARAVRAALPESAFKVHKPRRGGVDGGTFQIVRDAFRISVR
jgi:hypothetical protein